MITFQAAKKLATKKVQAFEKEANIPLAIIEEATGEFEYGWVFFYQSEEYVRTGNEDALVGGNAPIIVDKLNATIHTTGTGKGHEEYIRLYCKYRDDPDEFYIQILQ
jgi:hypothetical protein